MELEPELQTTLATILAHQLLGWSEVGAESGASGGYWSTTEQRPRIIWHSSLYQIRQAAGMATDRVGDGFVWAPFQNMADAWLVHQAMCAKDPATLTRYLFALAQRLGDKYGPPAVWTAPLAVMEPADICLAALESLAPDSEYLRQTLQLPTELLPALFKLPDGQQPEDVLRQDYSDGDNSLSVDANNPDELELRTSTMEWASGTLVYLHASTVRRLVGQLLLWLRHRGTAS